MNKTGLLCVSKNTSTHIATAVGTLKNGMGPRLAWEWNLEGTQTGDVLQMRQLQNGSDTHDTRLPFQSILSGHSTYSEPLSTLY